METRKLSPEIISEQSDNSPKNGRATALAMKFGAAFLAVINALPAAGCGSEQRDEYLDDCCYSGDPCDGCEEPEASPWPSPCGVNVCCETPAPKLETSPGSRINGNVWRVQGVAPEFDTGCKAPLDVFIEANLTINPDNAGVTYGDAPRSPLFRTAQLPPGLKVYGPGKFTVEGEQLGADSVTSYRVCWVDAQGQKDCADQYKVE